MIDRSQIVNLLKLNGIDIKSPVDEIKAILVRARWDDEDIDTALTVLHEDPKDHTQHTDTIHKVFRSDTKLNPATVSALLGVDMDISPEELQLRRNHTKTELTFGVIVNIIIVSFSLSFLFLLASMWYLGFFETGLL